ncbi:MAG: type III-B CRISPR module RAMP protein Cmr6 [Chloroflexi bacterium]|nr:type III-B CRISPR module RAMP protein Cmr6 [Chloroflexota bacterium]
MTRAIRSRLPTTAPTDGEGNVGLALDRYLTDAVGGENQALKDLLQRVGAAAPPSIYAAAYARWSSRLAALPNVAAQRFRVRSRLIVGLGGESVRETAVALLRGYGVPCIPGSALKGLASRYTAGFLSQADAGLKSGGAAHQVLFGERESAGYMTCFDAWYVPRSAPDHPFAQDVITVHHPSYYGRRGVDAAPWDFDDPNPVPLVSARGDYLVAVQGPDRAWADFALKVLDRALADWGIGAKTSSGYGRLEAVPGTALPAVAAPSSQTAISPPTDQPPRTETVVSVDHPLLAEVRALPAARVKPQANALYVRSKVLDEPVRRAVAEALILKLKAVGALRDQQWAQKPWVRELLEYCRALGIALDER